MGRALASSLLSDITVDRPIRASPEPHEPLTRRARRELREQRERDAAARGERHEFPPPSARPDRAPAQPSVGGLVRASEPPVRRDAPSAPPAAPDGTRFQVARPRTAPASEPAVAPTPTSAARPAPAPAPASTPEAAVPAPQRPPAPRPPVVRNRVRPVAPDPYAALPWPTHEAPEHRPAPESRPGSRIRDLDLTVARAEPSDGLAPEVEETRQRRLTRSVVEWVMVLGTAAVVALLLQHFVVQLYEIPSESMFPTLKDNDQVLVNKLAYAVGGGVERGDVIVFKRPASERTDDPDQPPQLIKRVIGLPGDVVEARAGVVYIDGEPLQETGDGFYLDPSVVTNNLPQPITVAPGHVFVMGDNRERSHDSRYFGAIPESDIIGRAVVIAWPFSRWGSL